MVISRYRAKINSRLCGKIVSSLLYQLFVPLAVVNQILAGPAIIIISPAVAGGLCVSAHSALRVSAVIPIVQLRSGL